MAQPVKKLRVGLYPGTFDPVTNGHLDVIARAARLLDKLVVGVAVNTGKGPLFTLEERVELVQAEIARIATQNGMVIEVLAFDTLLIDFARKVGASMIVRGLRAVSDFDYEFQMAGMNYRMAPDIETVFLMASERHQFIASRLVKEVAMLGGDISSFVPPVTHERDAATHPRLNQPDHLDVPRRAPMLRRSLIAGAAIATLTGEITMSDTAEAQTKSDPENTLYMDLKQGRVVIQMFPDHRAEGGGAGEDADARRVLRQHAVPPGDRGLHGAGRRSDRHGQRRFQAAGPAGRVLHQAALPARHGRQRRGPRIRTARTASSTSCSRRRRIWTGSTRSGAR